MRDYAAKDAYLASSIPQDGSPYFGLPAFHDYDLTTFHVPMDEQIDPSPAPLRHRFFLPFVNDNYVPQGTATRFDVTGGDTTAFVYVAYYHMTRSGRAETLPSVVAEIDGRVEYGKDYKTKRRLRIVPIEEDRERFAADPGGPPLLSARRSECTLCSLTWYASAISNQRSTRAAISRWPSNRTSGATSAAGSARAAWVVSDTAKRKRTRKSFGWREPGDGSDGVSVGHRITPGGKPTAQLSQNCVAGSQGMTRCGAQLRGLDTARHRRLLA